MLCYFSKCLRSIQNHEETEKMDDGEDDKDEVNQELLEKQEEQPLTEQQQLLVCAYAICSSQLRTGHFRLFQLVLKPFCWTGFEMLGQKHL